MEAFIKFLINVNLIQPCPLKQQKIFKLRPKKFFLISFKTAIAAIIFQKKKNLRIEKILSRFLIQAS